MLGGVIEALIVVVNGDRQNALGLGLTYHIIVENLADFARGRDTVLAFDQRGLALLADDVHAQFDAFIADEHRWPSDELTDFMLALPAEGAIERIFGVAFGLGHRFSPFRPLPPKRVVKRLTAQPNQTTLTKRSLRPCLAVPRLSPPSACRNSVRLRFDKQPPNYTQNQARSAKIMVARASSSARSAGGAKL